jgi:hypothetical protein
MMCNISYATERIGDSKGLVESCPNKDMESLHLRKMHKLLLAVTPVNGPA